MSDAFLERQCRKWTGKVITAHLNDIWAKLADLQATQEIGTAGQCGKRDTPLSETSRLCVAS